MQAFTDANLSAPEINGDSDHALATSVSKTLSLFQSRLPRGNNWFLQFGLRTSSHLMGDSPGPANMQDVEEASLLERMNRLEEEHAALKMSSVAAEAANAAQVSDLTNRLLAAQQFIIDRPAGENLTVLDDDLEEEDPVLPDMHKSTLKFIEPKKFTGSEDPRPVDVFLGSAERWLKYGSREPPHVDQWAMYASSLLTSQAEAHFAAIIGFKVLLGTGPLLAKAHLKA